jgi:hypothetical protein
VLAKFDRAIHWWKLNGLEYNALEIIRPILSRKSERTFAIAGLVRERKDMASSDMGSLTAEESIRRREG